MISKKIFIAHGKDYRLKNAVEKFLISIKLKPIILHKQASKGKTVIEKIEKHSDVKFAVVLLTPDDIGGPKKKKKSTKYLKPRARQNVILELGYFMGKLGRNKVAAIYKEGVEIPSDYSGVIFIPFNRSWRKELAKEIRASGIDRDLNKLSIKKEKQKKKRINRELEEGNKLLRHYEELEKQKHKRLEKHKKLRAEFEKLSPEEKKKIETKAEERINKLWVKEGLRKPDFNTHRYLKELEINKILEERKKQRPITWPRVTRRKTREVKIGVYRGIPPKIR